jgi:thymidylate synthase
VIDTLRSRAGSRNGIIQLFTNRDDGIDSNDIPCTCVIQFLIRRNKLHMYVHMRSNDAFLGLPHDIFSFTMLQEVAARELKIELGVYKHSVASLHLYDDTDDFQPRTSAQQYLDEGRHDVVPMPAMPLGDPWPSIKELVQAEEFIRSGSGDYRFSEKLDAYWADLITLLKIHTVAKGKSPAADMAELLRTVTSPAYRAYILDRIKRRLDPEQSMLDLFRNRENHAERNAQGSGS